RYKEGIICTDTADDMAIPNSKVSECAHMIHEIAEKNNVIMSVYGHCGSGVVHTKIMFDVTKKSQWNDANRAATQLYDYVRSVGGTTSGEHGIGLSKAPFWKKEKADSLNVMKQIKKALDPNNILNPHKLQDAPDDWLTATKLRYQVKN
ncbi:MAG: 2-hydroxy-acid oxidase, partial [Candidatus Cloacimonetes bacterium]|nr:2-hydroxy-acid oxidase [Candidatus Cloacimonadota bacterium]